MQDVASITPQVEESIGNLARWIKQRREKNRTMDDNETVAEIVDSITHSGPDRRIDDRRQSEMQHPLYAVFMDALHQAMYGKGERHGGDSIPFLEQPWLQLANTHGNGFLTGQAAKKIDEAVRGKTGPAFEREILGAIVYLGMALIHKGIEADRPMPLRE